MIDKIKNLIIENTEKTIVFFVFFVLIVSVIILFFTWRLNLKYVMDASINRYSEVSYDSYAISKYSNEAATILKISNSDSLYSLLDLEYVSQNGLNESNIKKFLLEKKLVGSNIDVLSGEKLYQNGDAVIYRIKYKCYDEFKIVNFIEESPYKYTISFDDYTELYNVNKKYTGISDGFEYEINLVNYNTETARYEIRLKNTNPQNAEIDFNNINTFCLVFDDQKLEQNSVVAEQIKPMTTGSVILRELNYTMPYGKTLNDCKGIEIRDVKMDDSIVNVSIKF